MTTELATTNASAISASKQSAVDAIKTVVREFDLTTTAGCIDQLVFAEQVTHMGYGIGDDAFVAYLKIEGNTVSTLFGDLKDRGCQIAKGTLSNRQSKLRKQGLLPAVEGKGGRPKAVDTVKEKEAGVNEVLTAIEAVDVEVVEPDDADESPLGDRLAAVEEDLASAEAETKRVHGLHLAALDENANLKQQIEDLQRDARFAESGLRAARERGDLLEEEVNQLKAQLAGKTPAKPRAKKATVVIKSKAAKAVDVAEADKAQLTLGV